MVDELCRPGEADPLGKHYAAAWAPSDLGYLRAAGYRRPPPNRGARRHRAGRTHAALDKGDHALCRLNQPARAKPVVRHPCPRSAGRAGGHQRPPPSERKRARRLPPRADRIPRQTRDTPRGEPAAAHRVRPGELRAAEWQEFDITKAEWRIPAERMKMRAPHLVPLSRQAVTLLEELRSLTGWSK